jgi:hypothetical protein
MFLTCAWGSRLSGRAVVREVSPCRCFVHAPAIASPLPAVSLAARARRVTTGASDGCAMRRWAARAAALPSLVSCPSPPIAERRRGRFQYAPSRAGWSPRGTRRPPYPRSRVPPGFGAFVNRGISVVRVREDADVGQKSLTGSGKTLEQFRGRPTISVTFIPAKAGIQAVPTAYRFMDSGSSLRYGRNDDSRVARIFFALC